MSSRSIPRRLAARAFLPTVWMAALALCVGCGEDSTSPPPEEFAPPTNLTYVNGDGAVFLRWQGSADAGLGDFRGYNVYRHTSSLRDSSLSAAARYKVNTSALTGLSYTDNSAVNGVKYYYTVRALKGSDTISRPTNEIDTAARTEADNDVTLGEFANNDQPSGLSLSELRAYTMTSTPPNDNRAKIDVYLGTTGFEDEPEMPLALKSPALVDGSGTTWTREAELVVLGTGQTAWDTPVPPSSGWSSSVTLGASAAEVAGKVIAVKSPPDNNGARHYAKIWIISMTGGAGQRVLTVDIAYQSAPDYPRFAAGTRR